MDRVRSRLGLTDEVGETAMHPTAPDRLPVTEVVQECNPVSTGEMEVGLSQVTAPVSPPLSAQEIVEAQVVDRAKPARPENDQRGQSKHIRKGRNKAEEGHKGAEILELKDWHKQVSDWFLMNPGAKIKLAAEVFHVTPEWMGRLLHSDLYRAYYEKRLTEHQTLVSQQVMATAGEVALKGMQQIGRKIDQQGSGMEMKDLVNGTGLAAKALGLGVSNQPGAAAVTVNMNGLNPELLQAARANLRKAGEQYTLAIDGEAKEILNVDYAEVQETSPSHTETEEEQQDDKFIRDLVDEATNEVPQTTTGI